MQKLLLSSAGIPNKKIADAFLNLVRKPPAEIKVIFIPTASRHENELYYVNRSKQELIDLGIKNIIILNLDHEIKPAEINNCDVIYVCGGNTFYLLKKVRESKFDEALKDFNGVYVGVSAGSIIMGPDIETAGSEDKNDINLKDTKGLNYVDFVIIPHAQDKNKDMLTEWEQSVSYKVKRLDDNQAVLVLDKETRIVGN